MKDRIDPSELHFLKVADTDPFHSTLFLLGFSSEKEANMSALPFQA
jgi:hypothetical protein